MSKYQKIKALIVKKQELGEADMILTVISEELGLLRLKAKGIKKLSSKNAPHLQSLNFTKIEIVSGKTDLNVIISAETIENFKNIKKDLTKIAFVELLLEHYLFLIGEDVNSENFTYFLQALKFIDNPTTLKKDLMNLIYMWLVIKLLIASGRRPEFYICSKCNQGIREDSKISFSPKYGGIICEKCQKSVRMGFVVNTYTIKLFRVLSDLEIQDLKKIAKVETSSKIYKTLNGYIKYYLENPLRSEKFFNDLIKA